MLVPSSCRSNTALCCHAQSPFACPLLQALSHQALSQEVPLLTQEVPPLTQEACQQARPHQVLPLSAALLLLLGTFLWIVLPAVRT